MARIFAATGWSVVVFTGRDWIAVWERRIAGGEDVLATDRLVTVRELPGLDATDDDDDGDAGAKLSARAARMCITLQPELAAAAVDLVICDVITVCGGWAAERLGVPWIELSPHPLYQPSRGLPPIGSGLAAGVSRRGRLRDRLMRAATARSLAQGERQRAVARCGIGLPAVGSGPAARFLATLPALEVPRPDWPATAHVIGPLLWEPTTERFDVPSGPGPLVVIAPSTAVTGAEGMVATAITALDPDVTGRAVRVVVSALDTADVVDPEATPSWVTVGSGRQDILLRHADLVICGGGHGMLAKTLRAGVPVVTVPGGGDQWELANRVARQGSGVVVRPVTVPNLRQACRRVLDDPYFARAARAAASTAHDVVDPVACAEAVVSAVVTVGPTS
ncbi:glycosyltransferase [Williamsia sp. CHRR-6]|uniref:glycosyltransferase n=1 Tax=Williamsia sp. CHRR-6 TaxID=2835871 RepID=UPI001BDB1D5F|nr:nucleotide disphospho-sugar-binding domain-containing protein [Williamsia sp. CHRR-6]MBT0567892.1 glycosyl transferase [Williamsia sp. CHRR-6]